jgi:hypothetical protein
MFNRIKEGAEIESRTGWPGWLYACVIVGALLMALGGVIALINPAMLLAPGEPITAGVKVCAEYLVSRNIALAVMLVVMLVVRARRMLCSLMLLTALIQALDAVLDARDGRWMLVPGMTVFAIVFLFGAWWLAGKGSWRIWLQDSESIRA